MVLHVGLISTSTAGTWWRFWQCAGCCTACAATPSLAWLHGYSRVPYPARPAKTEHQPAETSDRFTQIKPQPGLLKFHGSTTGGPCVDDDAASTSATTGRRAARRLRVGLEAGPGTAARLEAGSCGEGFASRLGGRPWNCGPPGGGQLRGGICESFPGQTVFSHQVCAGGSVLFRSRLSKAGLSEST